MMRREMILAAAGAACLMSPAAYAMGFKGVEKLKAEQFKQGLHASTGFWLRDHCTSNDQRRRDRCDGFIQGVASVSSTQAPAGCREVRNSEQLREAVVPRLREDDRGTAVAAVEAALQAAFPCGKEKQGTK